MKQNLKQDTEYQPEQNMEQAPEHNKFFTELSPLKLFFKCAIPSMISMAISSIYIIADGIFVGKFIGEDALAAINLVMPFIMISFALADMIAVGSSVQISIKLGEKNQKSAGEIFSLCTSLIVAISLVIGIIAYLGITPIIQLLGANPEVSLLAQQYVQVFAIFSPLIMISFALDNYLRICGRIHYSLAVNIFMSLLNIFLDWLLIAKLHYGIQAAALASCIGLSLCTIICLIPFLKNKMPIKFSKPRFSWPLLGNVIANGSSEFFSNISGSILMVITNGVLLHISGSTAVAAISIIMYVDSIIKPALFGMADALQPAISYNFGAGNLKRCYTIEKIILISGFVISILTMIIMQCKGAALIQLFAQENNDHLIQMSIHGMKIFSLSYIFSWLAIIASSFFTALNKPLLSIITAFNQTLIFPLLGLSILIPLQGLDGVWLTSIFTGTLGFIISVIFLLHIRKEHKRFI